MVPKILTDEQKMRQHDISTDLSAQLPVFDRLITEVRTCFS